jgi:hypothetical protein
MTLWLHAREEDPDDADELVFRPEGYPLPLARGREQIELRDDGHGGFVARAPGADDRPETTSEFDDYYVAELQPDRLTLKRDPRLP